MDGSGIGFGPTGKVGEVTGQSHIGFHERERSVHKHASATGQRGQFGSDGGIGGGLEP